MMLIGKRRHESSSKLLTIQSSPARRYPEAIAFMSAGCEHPDNEEVFGDEAGSLQVVNDPSQYRVK